MSLLDKTRKINTFIQKNAGSKMELSEIASLLGEVTESNVYLFNMEGNVIGYKLQEKYEYGLINEEIIENRFLQGANTNWFLNIFTTRPNLTLEELPFDLTDNENFVKNETIFTLIPISGGGDRLGTLIMAKAEGEFTEDDLILAEFSTSFTAMEILRSEGSKLEEQIREKAKVQIALDTLSYSELEALEGILEELDYAKEGLLVASRVADDLGITRSVIVNALRKLESAGVIESRSLGMKGTFIKILNDRLFAELEKVKL